MKFSILFTISLSLSICTAFAQSDKQSYHKQLALKESTIMGQRLLLDSTQKDKIVKVLTGYYEKIETIRNSKGNQVNYQKEKSESIRKILTPAQLVIYDQDMITIQQKINSRVNELKNRHQTFKSHPADSIRTQ